MRDEERILTKEEFKRKTENVFLILIKFSQSNLDTYWSKLKYIQWNLVL